MRIGFLAALSGSVILSACGPKVPPLTGSATLERIPSTELPDGHRKVTFRWTYADEDFSARGDGVARIASPDSVRLDFFVGGGSMGGRALLIGDQVRAPGGPLVRGLLPPAPLLWATLGRLRVPSAVDTTVRVDGDTLRADIGSDTRWRGTFVDRELRRLELIQGERLQQWVNRLDASHVTYHSVRGDRSLELTVVRTDTVAAFDDSIWR